MPKLHLVGLGCDKNTVDGERILSDFSKAGYDITTTPENADIIIINTCCFIESATEESINTILKSLSYKDRAKIIVTGCMAERYRDELKEEIPEIDYIIPIGQEENLVELLGIEGEKEEIRRYNTTGKSAYLKISEGCSRNCSYCIIPKLRGKHISTPVESLVEEAKHLRNDGVRELILVAQDLTQYGSDTEDTNLIDLLEALDELGFDWIRLLYLYPEGVDRELLEFIKKSQSILPYFDLPIQHTSNKILNKMGRYITREKIFEKVKTIRSVLPDAVIRSTVIVGFPGESDADFNTLYNDLESLKFDRLGAFEYSREEGTKAYNMPGQIEKDLKRKRLQRIENLQQKIMRERNERFVGRILPVFIEEQIDSKTYSGRIYADAPEIDCIVYVNSEVKLEIGDIVDVKILDSLDYEFIGDFYESS